MPPSQQTSLCSRCGKTIKNGMMSEHLDPNSIDPCVPREFKGSMTAEEFAKDETKELGEGLEMDES